MPKAPSTVFQDPSQSAIQQRIRETKESIDRWVASLPMEAAELPEDLASSSSIKAGAKTTHTTRAFVGSGYDWMRVSEIYGHRGTLIVNIAAFPTATSPLPLAQAEVVIVKGRAVLCIYDFREMVPGAQPAWLPCGSEQLGASLRATTPEETLPQVEERPDWTNGVISPYALWSRPATELAVPASLAALDHFMARLKENIQASAGADTPSLRSTDAVVNAEGIQRARSQSLAGNPSKRFLEAFFGPEWADRFLDDVLYPSWLGSTTVDRDSQASRPGHQ